ncbi:twin-arginine translocation signal domain-containing protein [Rhodovarius crocodyli]|uniref:Twin-arginine translocation signal domain-containing protein n=1 Tax=Rhodovarius crocodyli TaxID=1979269 RepID=A0A437MH52_9PROT|nr:formate dehydrogenase subunit alpha [Rhodovarius crocodyli]RVT96967.1 twin-arginine translocation signal domain-containing protein [Rhodovarius crocodyli]
MLIKRSDGKAAKQRLASAYQGLSAGALDRRGFLKQAGVAGAGLAAFSGLKPRMAEAAGAGAGVLDHSQPVQRIKNVCTHCSVGCTVTAEVQNGVWVGQEPSWDSPINRGTHCAKGASVRELVHGDRRIKYPMKLVGGQWQRISWDTAMSEIAEKLMAVRQASGPDSVFWLGSAKFSNEGAYLYRKLAAFWGTNSVDHQARICHSTTVAGVANTWGYGAMTNSYNDIRNAKTMIIMGGNPAEAHPVSLQHVLTGKEINRANLIVIDPRFTRTAAHATEYVRIRPGTDIPIIWGMLWHIFQNNWEDKQFIAQRVYGMDDVRAEVAKWNPEEVERVTGVPGAQLRKVAEIFATQKPSTLIWCMGATQKTVGTANVRAYSILLLATGNVGKPGTGANIFRGHCNVQGATDFGLDVTSLPGYYGLDEAAWRHWSRVWNVSYESMVSRFDSPAMMTTPGIPTTRYFDAITLPKDQIQQRDRLKAMVVFGHGGNTVTRMPEAVKGLEALDLLVVADPHPTTFAALSNRRDGTYLLPMSTQFETNGSRTSSNRSIQWGSRVVKPIFESRTDYRVMYDLCRAMDTAAERRNMTIRFTADMFKRMEIVEGEPSAESILREINYGSLSTGYSGVSPERLKLHMQHQDQFDLVTLRAKPDAPEAIRGDFYGLPWPCWGTPEMRHPGSHVLYNTELHVKEGGGTFRARFGVEREGKTLLAEGSYSKGSELTDGYPEFTVPVLKRLGWYDELTAQEKAVIEGIGGPGGGNVSWATDLSAGIIRVAMEHGCLPYGNAKARANAWNLPDPVPVHREPIYTPRTDLIDKYPTLPDRRGFRLPHLGVSVQNRSKEVARDYPIILSSGRLVEYEGGGEETRSNRWLAELQQDMFVEINPADAASRNIRDGGWVLVRGPEMPAGKFIKVKAMVTERVGRGVAWMPFHFAGWFMQEDQRGKYPQGTDPIVLGESVNAVTTYGYDPVTFMQETKVTLCQIQAA